MSQVANAFRIWVHFTMETRDRSQVAEHARLLKSAAQMHQKREEDLKSQLDSERERAIAEQSRLNDIILTTQQERDRLQSMLNIANARLQHLESDPKLQRYVQIINALVGFNYHLSCLFQRTSDH